METIFSEIVFTNLRTARNEYTLEEFKFVTDYSVVLDLDADIKIYIDSLCVFDCPMVPILEMYLQLKKWESTSCIDDFVYNSLESTTPMFKLQRKNDKWYFVSEYSKQKIKIEINILAFRQTICNFFDKFEKQFEKMFDLNVLWILEPFL